MHWILVALLLFSSAAVADPPDGPDLGDACTLAWDAPPTGVVRHYMMRCSPDAGGVDPLVFDLPDVLTTTCAEMGIPLGHWHCRVRACNDLGCSASSNEVPFDVPPLGAPSNLTVGP